MRAARRILGAVAAMTILVTLTQRAFHNRDYYGSPLTVGIVFAVFTAAPYAVMSLIPVTRQLRRYEVVDFIGLTGSLLVLALAWWFADTSLDSTAALGVLYAWLLAWCWIGFDSWLRSRRRGDPPPMRA